MDIYKIIRRQAGDIRGSRGDYSGDYNGTATMADRLKTGFQAHVLYPARSIVEGLRQTLLASPAIRDIPGLRIISNDARQEELCQQLGSNLYEFYGQKTRHVDEAQIIMGVPVSGLDPALNTHAQYGFRVTGNHFTGFQLERLKPTDTYLTASVMPKDFGEVTALTHHWSKIHDVGDTAHDVRAYILRDMKSKAAALKTGAPPQDVLAGKKLNMHPVP